MAGPVDRPESLLPGRQSVLRTVAEGSVPAGQPGEQGAVDRSLNSATTVRSKRVQAPWASITPVRHLMPRVLANSGMHHAGVIVFFLQIDTLTQKNSSRDNHLQNWLSRTACAFGAD